MAEIFRAEYQAFKQVKQLTKKLPPDIYYENLIEHHNNIHKLTKSFDLPHCTEKFISEADQILHKKPENALLTSQSSNLLEAVSIRKLSISDQIPPNSIPIIALVSYNCKILNELSKYIGYKLLQLKRSTVLEPNSIYETDNIDEKFFLAKQVLVLAIGWNESNEKAFINDLKKIEKTQLPCSLIGYCKKNAEEVIPRVEDTFRKTREKISKMQELQPGKILDLNDVELPDIVSTLATCVLSSGEFCENNLESFKPENCKNEDETDRKVICYLVVPLGMPGMGKSFVEPMIKKIAIQSGLDYYKISADEVREYCMKEYRKKVLGAEFEKVFKKTAKSANSNYRNQLFEIILNATKDTLIYCDKNHPPEAITSLIKHLSLKEFPNATLKFIGLAPKCESTIRVNNNTYEMSLDFVITCMSRVLKRESHLTLIGMKSKQLSVLLIFLNLYKNFLFDSCLEQRIDYVVKVPFANETGDIGGLDLRKSILEQIRTFRFDSDHRLLEGIADKLCGLPDFPYFSNEKYLIEELGKILSISNICKNEIKVPSVEIFKVKEEKKQSRKPRTRDIPVYIGIDLKLSLEPSLLKLVLNGLSEIYSFYPNNTIKKDIEEISKLSASSLSNSMWKFPNSLHITILFIGGDRGKSESKEYLAFTENKKFTIELTHLVYCAKGVICAYAAVPNDLLIENKFPHVTLLVSNKPPKYSNTILQYVNFNEDIGMSSFKDGKNRQDIYSYRLANKVVLEGISKSFH